MKTVGEGMGGGGMGRRGMRIEGSDWFIREGTRKYEGNILRGP